MIWQYVQLHWLEWLFTIITAILGFLYRDIRKRNSRKTMQSLTEFKACSERALFRTITNTRTKSIARFMPKKA